jgi:hypothetical protein
MPQRLPGGTAQATLTAGYRQRADGEAERIFEERQSLEVDLTAELAEEVQKFPSCYIYHTHLIQHFSHKGGLQQQKKTAARADLPLRVPRRG